LTCTPCYIFKTALKSLEVGTAKQIKVIKQPQGRRPGAYPDEQLEAIEVSIQKSEVKIQQSLFE
jgi:hypothetical protein